MVYVFKYDSTHGKWKGTVEIKDKNLKIDGNPITFFTERGWDLGSLTAANWVSSVFNVSYSSC